MISRALFLAAVFLFPWQAYAAHVKSEGVIDLTTDKVVELNTEVSPASAEAFVKRVKETSKLPGDRLVIIHSPGGHVDSGLLMIKALEDERAAQHTRLICVVVRGAHSMAFNLLTHCDIRLATKGTTMLVHKIEIIPDGRGRLTAENLRRIADDLDKEDEQFRQANAKAMGLTVEEYDAFARKETMWRAETLLRRGYLHGIATVEK